jgi:crossover junction endodeoxyribonuclease RusA
VTGRVWRLDLPMSRPLSLNGREHWRRKAALVKRVRLLAFAKAQHVGVPALPRIAVELHYVPRDRRRRDPLNLVATLKPVEDGLVDAGVVPDDTPEYVEPTMPRLDPPDAAAAVRLYVLVRELPAVTP